MTNLIINDQCKTEMEMKTLTKEKVVSIEQTVAKNNVRNSIGKQVKEYAYAYRMAIMEVATLAAENWIFEYGLLNNLKHSNILQKPPKLHFISAEKEKKTALASYINMPDNATVLKGLFSDIFKSPFRKSKAGFSYMTDNPKDIQKTNYNLVWADYCSYATTQLLNDFIYVVENHMNQGIIYLTFCLSEKRGAHKKSLKDLSKYSKSKDIAEATADAIKVFAKKIKGKKIRKVFEVIYGGGKTSGTSMVTIGFSVNIKANAITELYFDDSEWKSKDRLKRQSVVHNRLKKVGGWNVKKSGRRKSTKTRVKKTVEDIRLNGAVERWESKWSNLTMEKKTAIADKYGVTIRQFACKVAHKHGKLAKAKKKAK